MGQHHLRRQAAQTQTAADAGVPDTTPDDSGARGDAVEAGQAAEEAAGPAAEQTEGPVPEQRDDRAPGEAASATADQGLMANSRSMAVASLASRITGFLRSILLVAALGTGAVGNAYNSGNNLPNMIYELLLGGVLSSVLIPLLVRAESEDDDGGLAYTQRLLSIAVAALGAMTLVVVALAPWIAAVVRRRRAEARS